MITDVIIISTTTGTCTDSLQMAHQRHREVRDINTQQMRQRQYPHHYLVNARALWHEISKEVLMAELSLSTTSHKTVEIRPVIKRLRQWAETQEPLRVAQQRYTDRDIIFVAEMTVPWLTRTERTHSLVTLSNYGAGNSPNPAQRVSLLLQDKWRRWILSTAAVQKRQYNNNTQAVTLDWLMRELEQSISARQYRQLQAQIIAAIRPFIESTRKTRPAQFNSVIKRLLRSQGAQLSKQEQAQLRLTTLDTATLSKTLAEQLQQWFRQH